uniref:Uncharacterized protein n=1 Tax=Lygus hesperus TaxID=30085 RepID=A0A0A9WUG6_LYGHE
MPGLPNLGYGGHVSPPKGGWGFERNVVGVPNPKDVGGIGHLLGRIRIGDYGYGYGSNGILDLNPVGSVQGSSGGGIRNVFSSEEELELEVPGTNFAIVTDDIRKLVQLNIYSKRYDEILEKSQVGGKDGASKVVRALVDDMNNLGTDNAGFDDIRTNDRS